MSPEEAFDGAEAVLWSVSVQCDGERADAAPGFSHAAGPDRLDLEGDRDRDPPADDRDDARHPRARGDPSPSSPGRPSRPRWRAASRRRRSSPARTRTLAARLQKALSSPTFRLYRSTDVVGVEISGATKNVVAIAAGIVDGLKLGQNTRAALLTRALAEIRRLGTRLGGRRRDVRGPRGGGRPRPDGHGRPLAEPPRRPRARRRDERRRRRSRRSAGRWPRGSPPPTSLVELARSVDVGDADRRGGDARSSREAPAPRGRRPPDDARAEGGERELSGRLGRRNGGSGTRSANGPAGQQAPLFVSRTRASRTRGWRGPGDEPPAVPERGRRRRPRHAPRLPEPRARVDRRHGPEEARAGEGTPREAAPAFRVSSYDVRAGWPYRVPRAVAVRPHRRDGRSGRARPARERRGLSATRRASGRIRRGRHPSSGSSTSVLGDPAISLLGICHIVRAPDPVDRVSARPGPALPRRGERARES